jgi:hypothetical protein
MVEVTVVQERQNATVLSGKRGGAVRYFRKFHGKKKI